MVDAGDLFLGERRAPFPRRRRRERALSEIFRVGRVLGFIFRRPDRPRRDRSLRRDGDSSSRDGAFDGGRRRRGSGVFYDRLLRDPRRFAPFRRALRSRTLARFARPSRGLAIRRNGPGFPIRLNPATEDVAPTGRRAGKNGKNARFGVLGAERFDKIRSKRALPPCQRRVSASK